MQEASAFWHQSRKVVNLGFIGAFRLLVFEAADSLSMVEGAGCHMFPFLFDYFQGNDNQLLYSTSEDIHVCSEKTHIRKEPVFQKNQSCPCAAASIPGLRLIGGNDRT